MKPATEAKMLKQYVDVIDNPDNYEKKFRRNGRIFFTITMVFVFYLLSDNMRNLEDVNYIALSGFLAGVAFGLGMWFVQAGTQVKLFIKHMSKESINSRIEEISH